MQTVLQIHEDKVTSVYNGKAGACCCGCAGKHRYPTKYAAMGKLLRGYEIGEDEVSDRSVKMAINKVNKALREAPHTVDDGGSYMAVEDGNRITIVYLKTERLEKGAA